MFDITSNITSYYEIKNLNKHKNYSLTLILPIVGIFTFDNLDFIAGFVTVFGWIGEDHHKYWRDFKQLNDPNYLQGKNLTF